MNCTVKYDGICQTCGRELTAGETAHYRRKAGLFCLDCGEPETEALREILQEKANNKAERLEGWAEKRHAKAQACYSATPESLRADIAFMTQPGEIKERTRMFKRDEKGWEHDNKAREMESKAADLRHPVRVKGDAEREREAVRDKIKPLLSVGMMVDTPWFRNAKIVRLNPKSITIETESGYRDKVDYSWVTIPKELTS